MRNRGKMPFKTYQYENGDSLVVDYIGKVMPDAETVKNVFNGTSKDVRIKKVKKYNSTKDIGTTEGLVKNFGRGLTFSLSRKAEDNSTALDRWNEEHPVKSIAADIAGSIPSMFVPGGALAVGAKVLSKVKTFAKLAKVASKLKIANKIKTVAKVANQPVVKAATAGGAYSGFRSLVDSKDVDPDNITRNVLGSTLAGSVGGAALGFLGHKFSGLINKKATKAQGFINKLGGEGEFRKLTASNGSLIESSSPLIAQLLKSSDLSPYGKAVLFKNFMKVKNQIPEKIDKVVNELTPNKTQAQVMNKYKKITDTRYAQGEFSKPLQVKASTEEYIGL
jgi:hypothetical protein